MGMRPIVHRPSTLQLVYVTAEPCACRGAHVARSCGGPRANGPNGSSLALSVSLRGIGGHASPSDATMKAKWQTLLATRAAHEHGRERVAAVASRVKVNVCGRQILADGGRRSLARRSRSADAASARTPAAPTRTRHACTQHARGSCSTAHGLHSATE